MTRLLKRRLGTVGQGLATTLALTLVMASLGAGSGCKKTPKSSETQDSKMAPAKSTDAPVSPMGTKVGEKKRVAGMAANPAAPSKVGRPRPTVGPVKVQLVVGLNAAKLRKTFLWKKLLAVSQVKTLLSGKTYGQLKTALGGDPLVMVDKARFVLGGKSLNEIQKPDHLAVVLSGRFDAPSVLKKLLTIPVQAGVVSPVLTKINGKDAIRGKGKQGDAFALVAVNKNTIAMCSASMLDIVTKDDLTGGNAAIARQIKTTDTKALAWIVFGGVQIPLGAGSASPALAALKKIRGGAVVLDNDKTQWKAVNRLDVGSPQAANSLLQLVNMMKMAVAKSGSRPGLAPAFAALLKNMKVVAKNQLLIATMALSEADLKLVLDALLKKL